MTGPVQGSSPWDSPAILWAEKVAFSGFRGITYVIHMCKIMEFLGEPTASHCPHGLSQCLALRAFPPTMHL